MESCNEKFKENKEKKKIKSLDKLENIKSKFILQKIFNNLERKKALDLVKKNKKIKKLLNININDYREYSEKYSSIEIEIKPVVGEFGKFINFSKENEIYYHIYFNNNKNEIKRSNINKNERIKIIKITIDYKIKSLKSLFEYCESIESIFFKKFCRNNINNMDSMFAECSSLKELNINNFNTDNVTTMSCMFYGCSSLKKLNINNFNTNNVIDMNNMFFGCSSLEELNLNNFENKNVKSMVGMFSKCFSLKRLYLNNFNTNNTITMFSMFYGC